MQINYNGEDRFEIKTRDASINLSVDGVVVDGFTINGPGEFERKGVSVEGVQPNGDRTIFVINLESINICYPGALKEQISDEAAKLIGDIDILMVPLGQKGSFDMKKARDFISLIDPRVVVPMLYDDISDFKNLEGATEPEVDSLKIKRADLPENERKIIIISPKK